MDPVLSRRSVREYTAQPVSDEMLHTLLKAAMVAPSAGDERPWHFVVIDDRRIREKIPEIHRFAHMAPNAPVAVLVCGDENLQKHHGFWVQDCAAATENILIEAQQLGLGAVWLGVYPVEGRVQGLRRLLDIPEHVIPFALVFAGYPAEHKKPAKRYDESRVHTNCWNSSRSAGADEVATHLSGNGKMKLAGTSRDHATRPNKAVRRAPKRRESDTDVQQEQA